MTDQNLILLLNPLHIQNMYCKKNLKGVFDILYILLVCLVHSKDIVKGNLCPKFEGMVLTKRLILILTNIDTYVI